ncbi:MAG: hypothetical protein HYY00_01080 [Chloroflexi bacterium]|nr:hypothetical protein [Chloroflexota bacterium]
MTQTAVNTAQEATDIAVGFLKQYKQLVTPVKAQREGDEWTVLVDVGVFRTIIATFHIDAATGAIKDYDIPTPASG